MNKKHYSYEFILYSKEVLDEVLKICIENSYLYSYILHNKDDNKEHYHFLIFFSNQRYINSVSKEFDIPLNLIDVVQNKKYAIQYLVHYNEDNKYHYQINEIYSNFDIIPYFTDKEAESDSIILIIEYIDSSKYVYYRDLMGFVVENNLWSVYRRNYSILKDLLYEHNLMFTKQK